ncbi:MAG TPA: CHC2 zinc finger domain-containing protein [Niabella sp.]|nr:CHC2 zinc finger domain-containing protein [Niabella sp.]
MTPQKMTCEQAKKLDIVSYLEQLNCRPSKVQGNDYWYYSPFHKEHTPSFKVNRKLNVWYDHSLGKGGNLVDFGITYHNCSVVDFLEKLNDTQQLFSFHQQHINLNENERTPINTQGNEQGKKETNNPHEQKQTKMKVLAIKDLQSPALKDYFRKREITLANAEKYCKETIVEVEQRKISMIGFRNNSGGFELRSIGNIKSTIAPKDVSFFENEKPALAVVEGLFDFLSLLEKQQELLPELTNFLVLNSLSFFERSLPLMKEHERVYLLLDNDVSGKNCTASAMKQSQKFKDLSYKYVHHKDLNEWLVKEKTHAQEQSIHRGFGLRR